jgi:FkbM family methyltransferase
MDDFNSNIIVDIGASNGEFSEHILSNDSNSLVFAVEPNIELNQIKLNNILAKYKNRLIYCPYALSDKNSVSPLYGAKIYNGQVGSLHKFNSEKKWSTYFADKFKETDFSEFILVNVKSVKEFISDNKISHIKLLKIDAQGSDVRLLELFLNEVKIDCIILEVNASTTKNENIYVSDNSIEDLLKIIFQFELRILKIIPNRDLSEFNFILSKDLIKGNTIIDSLKISQSLTFGRFWEVSNARQLEIDKKQIKKTILKKLVSSIFHPKKSLKSALFKLTS